MKLACIALFFLIVPIPSHADFWGGDLPLLAEIVTNTLNTLMEIKRQTGLMSDEMDGINDKINRIETISQVIQPSTWDQWKDPASALRHLQTIYYTLPKDYRSEKSDLIEDEISKAMNMVSGLSPGSHSAFLSGKELERRGADSSPGVAQKLTASGVGSLVELSAQTQIIESHITSLLAQILASANEKEARVISSQGAAYQSFAGSLGSEDGRFSTQALSIGVRR